MARRRFGPADIFGRSILAGLALALSVLPAAAKDLAAMSRDEVTALQRRLTEAGCYTGAIDGRPGSPTESATKACPDQNPVLRIETGMHTAPIWHIGVDAACRLAATASNDKSVRLWSLPDGRLLRTVRLPIGDGHNGKVFAVAVSPDGRWTVAGGWDARWESSRNHAAYLFDSNTGASVRRIGAFGSTIKHMAFSPDGKRLAVALASTEGVRVHDVESGRELMADRDYGADSYGLTFGPDGTLYTAAYDGFLRRYGPDMQRTAKMATRGGKQPFSVSVDPAGKRLAVGYLDSTALEIYDASSLNRIATADTKDVDNGNIISTAWFSDGRRLIAGGQSQKVVDGTWRVVTRLWDPGGKRVGANIAISNDTNLSLIPCGNAIAFSSADPAFGLVRPDGTATTLGRSRIPDMRDKREAAFTVSSDGMRLRFGIELAAKQPVLFDLRAGTIVDAPSAVGDLHAADTSGLKLENWLNSLKPTLDGKPIALESLEYSHSFAVRPDRAGFALGGTFWLRGLSSDGRQRWQKEGPGVAWGVTFAHGGDLVVVAYGDGTLRWHRWSDGQELLALFVHRDDRRWVAWTPTGYYMASPGADDLIGWHLNRGWTQPADFFPASRFRERFARADIVKLVLETLDEDTAIKRANETANRKEDTKPLLQRLPPVIRITGPSDGARFSGGEVTIGYEWRSPSGLAVERVDVLMDGRLAKSFPLDIQPVPSGEAFTGTLTVSVPAANVEVALIARAGESASEPAKVRLTWAGAPPRRDDVPKPKLYALVVGVSKYVMPDLVLGFAAKDAHDFADALEKQKGGLYSDVITRVITDGDATRASVIEGLEWLEQQVTSRDVGIVFLAGHGINDEKQTYWFLPADASPQRIRTTAVAQDDIRRTLQSLAGKAILFLDTCHAGQMMAGAAARRGQVDINSVVNEFASAENGIIVFASSTGREVALERADWANGAFTRALVEGFEGKADLSGSGTVTLAQIHAFVLDRVKELTEGKQHPVLNRPPTVPDFPLAVVRKR